MYVDFEILRDILNERAHCYSDHNIRFGNRSVKKDSWE